jgi:tetratricopeptide (TPR) repeat protein
MKTTILLFTISFNLLFSCKQSKESAYNFQNVEQNVINNPISNKSLNEKCQFEIINRDLVIKCKNSEKIYKNLIINEVSISTDVLMVGENNVELVYEMNGSVTKVKEKYCLQILDNELFLIYKEIVKFNQNGIGANRLYLNFNNLKNYSFEGLQTIGENIEYFFNDENPIISIYSFDNKIFGELKYYNMNTENFYVSYPDLNSSNEIIVKNVEEANNLAFVLEGKKSYHQSIYILQAIIKQFPNRVVAYLNLADAYWGLGNIEEAKKYYEKYISLMKSQGKDLTKIPLRVYERIDN